ncbi:MAG: MarR family winged helix-turn-helix transcriptional regulator, partial [Pseudomonadota bacterium]
MTESSFVATMATEEAMAMGQSTPSHATPGVAAVRRFSRFYTRQLGLLDEHLLASPFSLTESRVLFELAHHEGLAATDLVRDLALDAGYVSRILRRFAAQGLLRRSRAATDARRSVLALTARGRAAIAPLERASSDQVTALLDRLPPGAQGELLASMATIEFVLTAAPRSADTVLLRAHRTGDIGWIAHRQGL